MTVKLGFHPPERLAAATVERADPLLRWGCPGTDVANAVRADRVWLQSDTKDWLFVAYQLRSATEARDAIAAIAAMARTCTADAFTYTGHPAPDIGDAAALVSLVDKEGVVVDCFGQTERQLMSRCRQDELFFAIGDHVVQAYLYGEWYPGSEAEYLDELIRIGEAAESALR
ncbi:MAG: hypothetical protein R2749_24880 [Acidimicrobiales bacterium]